MPAVSLWMHQLSGLTEKNREQLNLYAEIAKIFL